MIEQWSVEKEIIKIELLPMNMDCTKFTFPVIVNPNEKSELFLIQLRHIYLTYVNFVDKLLIGSCRISDLTYNQVEALNFIAETFYKYVDFFELKKYNLYYIENWKNMSPTQKTPFCEYVYYAAKDKINEIDNYFEKLDIHKVTSENEYY